LDLPGITYLQHGWSLQAQKVTDWNFEAIAENPNPLAAWIDADAIESRLVLRTRRNGDRFHPQGMPSEMRLSDFLINVKIPRRWRDHLPIVDAGGQILWVSGIRLSEKALVRRDTDDVVHLRFQSPLDTD
jgi:tRNA(Ile)-lysidine synthase